MWYHWKVFQLVVPGGVVVAGGVVVPGGGGAFVAGPPTEMMRAEMHCNDQTIITTSLLPPGQWHEQHAMYMLCKADNYNVLASFPGSLEREMYTRGEPGIFSHVIMA